MPRSIDDNVKIQGQTPCLVTVEAWKEARNIVNRVYSVCRVKEFRRDYSLVNQVKRAAKW